MPQRADIAPDRWIRRLHPRRDPALRLVCLPHAGGSASAFLGLSAEFADDVEVWAVQYPGRQDRYREPPVERLDALADELLRTLSPQLTQPFAIFGHSMGALLGFELALRLEAAGQRPERLFASGRRAPGSPHRGKLLHTAHDDDLIAEMRRLSGTNEAVFGNEELLRFALPAMRGDFTALETYEYRPGQPLRCPVTALFADADPLVTAEEAREWGRHTLAGCDVRLYRGGHFYLSEQWSAIADAIRSGVPTAAQL
jgi:surfactin synthase thioesterase subunit